MKKGCDTSGMPPVLVSEITGRENNLSALGNLNKKMYHIALQTRIPANSREQAPGNTRGRHTANGQHYSIGSGNSATQVVESNV